jgi:hypothetical protein
VEWKGKKLEKTTDIIDFGLTLTGKEQKEFVNAVEKEGEFALQNIGYFSGYYSKEKSKEICQVFRTEHPVFGKTDPSPEQAFAMGEKMGTAIRDGQAAVEN